MRLTAPSAISHFIIFLLLSCSAASHSDEDTLLTEQQRYKASIDSILASDTFHQKKIESGWRLKNISEEENRDEIPEWLIKIIEFFEDNPDTIDNISETAENIAMVIEVILWIAFIIVIVLILRYLRQPLAEFMGRNKPEKDEAMPTKIAGLEVSKESLPEDILTTASNLWDKKYYRKALGLLYRATLSRLLHDYQCPLLGSDTEKQCLEAVKQLKQPAVTYLMEPLTESWQQLAYGHRAPNDETFQHLCQLWHNCFTVENTTPASTSKDQV